MLCCAMIPNVELRQALALDHLPDCYQRISRDRWGRRGAAVLCRAIEHLTSVRPWPRSTHGNSGVGGELLCFAMKSVLVHRACALLKCLCVSYSLCREFNFLYKNYQCSKVPSSHTSHKMKNYAKHKCI